MENEINIEKSKIMHFRQKRKQQSNFQFKCGSIILKYFQYYKYLGLFLDAYLNFNNGIKTLADSRGWAFGTVNSSLTDLKMSDIKHLLLYLTHKFQLSYIALHLFDHIKSLTV